MSFTDVGNKPPKASKASDGAFPTKKAGSVRKQTGKAGFPTANQGKGSGDTAPRASAGKDGNSGTLNDLRSPDMTDGGVKPGHGKAFDKKFNVSAMSQVMKGRASGKSFYGGGAS